ncbi:hypothetical protein Tco_0435580 [Tanacetum coccineum]
MLITHQGSSQVKDNKIDILVQQYEQFIIFEDESINNAFARFNTIITSLKALDEGTDISKITRKQSKTGKHGHENQKSTKRSQRFKAEARKVKSNKSNQEAIIPHSSSRPRGHEESTQEAWDWGARQERLEASPAAYK